MLQSMSTVNATCACHEDRRGRWERQREILQSSLWSVPLTAPPTGTMRLLHLNGLAPSLGLAPFLQGSLPKLRAQWPLAHSHTCACACEIAYMEVLMTCLSTPGEGPRVCSPSSAPACHSFNKNTVPGPRHPQGTSEMKPWPSAASGPLGEKAENKAQKPGRGLVKENGCKVGTP